MPTDAQHTKAHPKQKSPPSLINPLLISSIALRAAHTVTSPKRARPQSPAGWARLAQRTDPEAAHRRTRTCRDPAPRCQGRRSFCEHFRSAGASRRAWPAPRATVWFTNCARPGRMRIGHALRGAVSGPVLRDDLRLSGYLDDTFCTTQCLDLGGYGLLDTTGLFDLASAHAHVACACACMCMCMSATSR